MNQIWFAFLFVSLGANGALALLPAGPTLLDPDVVWDTVNGESWALSPDRSKVAYISMGSLWICNVASGPPTKIADLPNTATMYMALPEYAFARTSFRKIRERIGNGSYNRTIGQEEVSVLSLAWTPSQSGLVYGLRKRYQNNRETAVHRVMFASTSGEVKTLATIQRDRWARPHTFSGFHVAPDQRMILAMVGNNPLVWDVAKSSPRVTPYDCLLPSATSNRYLGIEVDSRQLVIVNDEFDVEQRFDETLREGRQCDLLWSADEHFAVCRVKDEYSSSKWEGFRLNLVTGETRRLSGDFFADQFWFTGQGGELARAGILGVRHEYVDGMAGGILEIIPDGDGPPKKLVDFRFDASNPSLPPMPDRPNYPLPVADTHWERFIVALPRKERPQIGFFQFLIDRSGRKLPFPAGDSREFIAPFVVLAFVDQDRRILARTETQLFSFPVDAITNTKGVAHE
jgi:hypothetical protein